jgi:pyruvate formate lyase activating enzyme
MDFLNPTNCILCHNQSDLISQTIGVCTNCLRYSYPLVKSHLEDVHTKARQEFNLPGRPPQAEEGIRCALCSNECQIDEGEFGFCGLRTVQNGRITHLAGTPARGLLHWYRDPLPTNCVADWVCEGSRHPGDHNLAVFYSSCTANCLFCQNWHYRQSKPREDRTISAQELAKVTNPRTFCVCYFGGDPSSQMPHALAASKRLAQQGVRICWETNGMLHPKLLERALEYSLESGGCIKFDLKAFNEGIHRALTGVSNQRTLENFTQAGIKSFKRSNPPLVIASTLLVPGYIEAEEVKDIAAFIASINADIPYSLLAFAPNFLMPDLPPTKVSHAMAAERAALRAGLSNVRIGNRHLLGLDPDVWF